MGQHTCQAARRGALHPLARGGLSPVCLLLLKHHVYPHFFLLSPACAGFLLGTFPTLDIWADLSLMLLDVLWVMVPPPQPHVSEVPCELSCGRRLLQALPYCKLPTW